MIIFLGFLLSANMLFSQNTPRVGLSGTVQSDQFGISVPVWLSENFALAPSIGILYAEKVSTDFAIGLASRFYFSTEGLAPYFALNVGTAIKIPSDDNIMEEDIMVDFIFGLGYGAEYFISDHFSLGVEAQLNLTKSDENSNRFGNPGGVNINTATMITATIYF